MLCLSFFPVYCSVIGIALLAGNMNLSYIQVLIQVDIFHNIGLGTPPVNNLLHRWIWIPNPYVTCRAFVLGP